jgi:PilZ domain
MSEFKEVRRSERVTVELPVEVSGTDLNTGFFTEKSRTIQVSRHGAKIALRHSLAPHEEISLRCVETGQEVEARIIGMLGKAPRGHFYGVAFLNEDVNVWGINFPPPSEGEPAAGRSVLECTHCRLREIVHLDPFEVEVLEANESLNRMCPRCGDLTNWKKSFFAEGPPKAPHQERGREPRRPLRIQACVNSREFGMDVVMTRDISRGGLCFESRKNYIPGWHVEVALPFTERGGNIFLAARIARVQPGTKGFKQYGVAYLQAAGTAHVAPHAATSASSPR